MPTSVVEYCLVQTFLLQISRIVVSSKKIFATYFVCFINLNLECNVERARWLKLCGDDVHVSIFHIGLS